MKVPEVHPTLCLPRGEAEKNDDDDDDDDDDDADVPHRAEMISITTQNVVAATLVDDAPHMLDAWEGTVLPLWIFLHGDAPVESRGVLLR